MKTLLKIAWRSIWRNKRRTAITVAAIAFALGLAVFFVALAHGIYGEMIDQAVRMQAGHVTLQHAKYLDGPSIDLVLPQADKLADKLKHIQGVETVKIQIVAQGMARTGGGAGGVTILGVQPGLEAVTSAMKRRIVKGRYLRDEDLRAAVIGTTLADRLKLKLGQKMVVTSNDANGDLVEELVRIKGIFTTGSPEIDGYLVQVPLDFTRELFGWRHGEATRVGLVLREREQQAAIIAQAQAMVSGDPIAVLPWQKVMPELATYVKIDGGGNYIFIGILIALSLFTIFNTILMSVLERTREFAVMLALGTSAARLKAQVVLESAMIGIVGCATGLGWGGALAWWLELNGFDPRSIYGEGMTVSGVALDSTMHANLTFEILLYLGLLVFTAILLTNLFTLRRVNEIAIADVLR